VAVPPQERIHLLSLEPLGLLVILLKVAEAEAVVVRPLLDPVLVLPEELVVEEVAAEVAAE